MNCLMIGIKVSAFVSATFIATRLPWRWIIPKIALFVFVERLCVPSVFLLSCLFFSTPLRYISLHSTVPERISVSHWEYNLRNSWRIRQAVFWVTSMSRANWCELTPFLLEEIRYIAKNHWRREIFDLWKIVPSVQLKLWLHDVQWNDLSSLNTCSDVCRISDKRHHRSTETLQASACRFLLNWSISLLKSDCWTCRNLSSL